MSIYGNLLGPAGRAVGSGAADLVGWSRVFIPLLLLLVGACLVARRRHAHADTAKTTKLKQSEADSRRLTAGGAARADAAAGSEKTPARVALGCTVAIVGIAGVSQLANGPAKWGPSLDSVRHSGGVIGFGIGTPLHSGIGGAGAAIVLCAVLLVGLLVATGVPVSRAVAHLGNALGAGVHGLMGAGRWAADAGARSARGEASFRHPVTGNHLAEPGEYEDWSDGDTDEMAMSQQAPSSKRRQERYMSFSGLAAGGQAGKDEQNSAHDDTAEITPAGAVDYGADRSVADPPTPAGEADYGAIAAAAAEGAAAGAAAHRGANAARGSGVNGAGGSGANAAGGSGADGVAGSGEGAAASRPFNMADSASESGKATNVPLMAPGTPGTWKLPPVALLRREKVAEVDRRTVEAQGRRLEEALANHGTRTHLVGATVGPSITRFELELAPGVKVSKVTSLQKDIAYAMAAADVRILAPIPGKSAIGVEVPNQARQIVALGDILASPEAKAAKEPLEVGVGRDIAGRAVMEDMAKMPHILIAGATGAGKSSCINSIITSILVRSTPDQVRMILIDPKRVELGQYNNLPHLLTNVVVNPKKAANALSWAVHEMERRYDLLADVGVRDITGYNAAYDRGELEPELGSDTTYSRLSHILVVVDELNDLMMVAARDVEESIVRISQMARAVGIHLVIATQRPSVDVITGVIKANVPSRLAFAVSSLADSRVILDQPGAERLIGKGDMLLLTASSSVARRIQGAWVEEADVRKVVAHWRRQGQPNYVEGVEGDDSAGSGRGLRGGSTDGDSDDMLDAAMDLVVRSQLGSTSMLQRKLRVGFARAGRLMDLLEQRGVVGPSEGSKARAVLMTVEELEEANPDA